MPNSKNLRMEHMSEAYLEALCAVNGFSMTPPSNDNEGYDQEISCPGWVNDDHTSYKDPNFRVQLKSTYSAFDRRADGQLVYNLRAKNYNDLVVTNRMTPLILVVLWMYEDVNDWIEQTDEFLKITRRAYWMNLSGQDPTENSETKTIEINENQLLTAESLKELMIRASKGERL